MTRLLNIKPFRQTPRYCGPASLKIILEYYGISKSEKELVRMTRCTIRNGTRAKNIVLAARELGLKAYIQDNSKISDILMFLNKGIPVIVDWFSHDEGHYSVAIGYDKKNIYLQDPELGHMRSISRKTFIRIWFDFEDEYMKTNKDIILRRMIVIKRK